MPGFVDPRILLSQPTPATPPVTLLPYAFPRRFRWWRPRDWRALWRDVRFVLHWRLWL